MDNSSKNSALFLVLLLAVSSLTLLTAVPANAQSTPKPSTPEFTLRYVADFYDVPTTYKTDPYTGEKVVDVQGYLVNNSSIQVLIKNQPFVYSYNGINYYLYYNVRYKGHFSEQWVTSYYYSNYTLEIVNPKYPPTPPKQLAANKNSDCTITEYKTADYPANAQLDFQVEAVTMYDGKVRAFNGLMDFVGAMVPGYVLGESSGWSSTQTITIGSGAVTTSEPPDPQSPANPTVNPSSSPTQNSAEALIQSNTQSDVLLGLNWERLALIVAAVVIVILAAALVTKHRRRA